MFKHILVPTDFTEKSRESIKIASQLASTFAGSCNITLLHVIELIEGATYEEFSDFYEKLKRRSDKKLDELVASFSKKGLKLCKKTVVGNRVKEILNFIEENAVDLVVLSSHKVEPEQGLQGWGTISYKVGLLAPCPVMMVK